MQTCFQRSDEPLVNVTGGRLFVAWSYVKHGGQHDAMFFDFCSTASNGMPLLETIYFQVLVEALAKLLEVGGQASWRPQGFCGGLKASRLLYVT